MALLVRPSPFALCCCGLQRTLGSFAACLGFRLLVGPRLQPWLCHRDRLQVSGSAQPCCWVRFFATALPLCSLLDRSRAVLSSPTPPEVCRPSGGVTAGVRFSRVSRPGIFRPWPFSDLRRLTPPDGLPVLFHTSTTYGIQRTRARAVSPRGPDRSTRRTVPSWITRPGRTSSPKTTSRNHHECMRSRPEPVLNTFTARKAPTCHSPQRLQADDAGGGHIDKCARLRHPGQLPPGSRRRRVTHHNACKQTMQEEGTSTGNGAQTNHGPRTPSPAATTPYHPNDNAGRPL